MTRAMSVSPVSDWHTMWPERSDPCMKAKMGELSDAARPASGSSRAALVTGALLASVAVAEAVVRAVVSGATVQYALVLCLLALATTVPVSLERPVGAAVAVSVASVVSLVLFHTLTVGGAAGQVLVLFGLGLATSGRVGALSLPVGLSAPFVVLALAGPRATTSEAQFLTVVLAATAPAAAVAGIARRARCEARMHSAHRDVIAGDLVDHAARAERTRIARELHDVVAHHISMVAVQAEAARLTTADLPAEGAQRFGAIGEAARAALTEMRQLLGVLRSNSSDDASAQRAPQPGLGQINDLLDQARDASGSGTRLIMSGSPIPLDPGVELAAYRIAQEALTNARRHAPGAAVDVELHYAADALRVRVRDNGPGPDADRFAGVWSSDGHGLAGMRERAAAVGGRLDVGGAPGGGFVVEAVLPVRPEVTR